MKLFKGLLIIIEGCVEESVMKLRKKHILTCVFILFFLIGSFCFITDKEAFAARTSTIDDSSFLEVISDSPEYVIGAEDVLEVSVWKNPDLSKVVIVRPDGKISLPLIGDVKADGLTPITLQNDIAEKLKKYQDTAIISVTVQEINSYKIFMLGEVMTPGMYIIKRKTSVLQAIALAGGFNQFASKKKVLVIREAGNKFKKEKISVSFDDIVNPKKNDDQNLILRPGDTIFVP
ncbi:MAG: polysaccharide biosynthesis/export family protein [Thermodesulfovibrionia bacterium]|nr:polysaccharide biosynthesis/export family protein [Thermodesulfovibrionia bacterium]